MIFLRRRHWVAFFFMLITLGQAYPYSVAWSAIQEGRCFCNENGRDCTHGCPTKRKKPEHSSPCHSHQDSTSVAAAQHSNDQNQFHSGNSHSAKKKMIWEASSCAQKKRGDILKAHSEVFLISRLVLGQAYPLVLSWKKNFASYPLWFEDLESPPPKIS